MRYQYVNSTKQGDAEMSNKVSAAFQRDYRAAVAGRTAMKMAEQGFTWEVRRQQKNGTLGTPSQFDINLTEAQAMDRKAYLEKMNAGSVYVTVNTAR
jgi:hypothetical protein